jgi:acyl carrier protein
MNSDRRLKTMEREIIMSRIADCLKEVSLGKITTINDNDRIEEDLGIDSMGATDLVFSLEDEFSISISDSELFEIKTINDIAKLIQIKNKNTAN